MYNNLSIHDLLVSDLLSVDPNAVDLLNDSLLQFQYLLQGFAQSSDFGQKMAIALGDNLDFSSLQEEWQQGLITVPPIEVRSLDELDNAWGAFAQSTGTIYLAKELLETQSLEQFVAVLLEEYGHYVDSQINTVDADGDEGDIFSRLVRGLEISEPELEILKAEDDLVTINTNNTEIIGEANFRPVIPTKQDFVWYSFNHQTNEIGLKLGNLFLKPLFENQPVHWIRDTELNKQKVHNYKYFGVNSDGIRVGLSRQEEHYERITVPSLVAAIGLPTTEVLVSKVVRLGDFNIDASATVSGYVNSNHQIIANNPKAFKIDHSSSSGIYNVADFIVSTNAFFLDFFISGDLNYTSALQYIAEFGGAIYKIYDDFSNDILGSITDPTQRTLIQRGGPLYHFISSLYALDAQQPDLYLGDIRFEEGEGVWLVWNYQEWIEDIIEDVLIKPLGHDLNLVGVDSGLVLSNRNPVAISNNLFDSDAFSENDSNYRNITNVLLSNDSDSDSDTLTITSVNTSATKGSVSLQNGQVSYSHDGKFDYLLPNLFALDSFEYTISDGRGGTDTARVSIKINGANDLPTAVNDIVRIKSDSWTQYITTELKANDYDPDQYEILKITSINTNGTKGKVTLSNGIVGYDPDDKFNGLGGGEFAYDYFIYTLTDKAGATDTATVTVIVEGVNTRPVAEDDEFEINEDSNGLNVTSILLGNDSDPNTNDTLSIISVEALSFTDGIVSLNNGVVTYTPGSEFQDVALGDTKTDYFRYVVSDGKGGTDTGYVKVTVTGSNDAPIAGDDLIEINENSYRPILWDVDYNDGDPDFLETYRLNFVSFDDTDSKGEVSFYEGGSGTKYLQYDSKGQFDYLGVGETTTDRFSYTIEDPHGLKDTANVVLKIIGQNDAPIAGDDAVTVNENDGAIDITNLLLSNDSDEENDPLNIGGFTDSYGGWSYNLDGIVEVINGRLTYNPNGQFEYLTEGQTATDTFYYFVSDDYGAVDRGKVIVTIEGDNDKPIANDDTVTVSEDELFGVSLPEIDDNDTDEDKDNLEIISLDDTNTLGQVSLHEGVLGTKYVRYHRNGWFNYLGEGETGTDTFIYTIKDSGGLIDSATVTVIIEGKNDAPIALSDYIFFSEDDGILDITSQLLDNDIDFDNSDSITMTEVDSSSTKGLVTFNNGVVTYSPNGQFETLPVGEIATDTFLYTISDEQGETNQTKATIVIGGAEDLTVDEFVYNRYPIATDNEIIINEDDSAIDITDLILADDTDPDGDSLSIIELDVSDSADGIEYADGIVSLVDGRVSYNPNGQFESLKAGETVLDGPPIILGTFSYTISDGKGKTDKADVKIFIEGENDKPIANDDTVTLSSEDYFGRTLFELWLNDTDADLGEKNHLDYIKINTNQTKAQASLRGDLSKSIHYDPDDLFDYLKEGETTTDTFTYTVATQRDSYDTIAEFGTITNITDTPQTINLSNTYENPVFLVQIASFNDPEPAVARLTEVTNNSFTVFVDEAEYLDGIHGGEDLSYFVIEAGSYFLPDGTFLEAGNFYSDVLVSEDFTTINFNAEFNEAPLVFSQVQTFEETHFIKTRQQNITPEGFEVGMEKEEALANSDSAFEKIGWFAIDSSEGTWDDYSYQAGNTGNVITHNFSTLNLSSNFTTIPNFFASIATYNDADPANLRYENLQSNSVSIKVEEEQSADSEINHIEEEVNFFAIAGQGTLTAGNLDEDADTATVIVTIEGINDEPEARNDEIYINEDSAEIDITDILLSNDSDIDKDPLSITEIDVSEYAYGIISLVNGRVTYNPNGQFEDLEVGETNDWREGFSYTISDGKGGTDEADVDIIIEGENDKPIANDDTITMSEDSFGKLLIELDDNDIDDDRRNLEYIGLDTTDTKGQVNFQEGFSGTIYVKYDPNGQFDYLKQGETATDTFIYTIQDKEGETDSATVTVIIEGVNETPNAGYDSLTLVNNGSSRDITSLLLQNDSDLDNDTLKITAIESYSWTSGAISVNNGIVTYQPDGGDTYDSFKYTVTDDFGATSTGFVSISLTKPEIENIAPSRLQFNTNKQSYNFSKNVQLTNAFIYDENGYSDVDKVDLWIRTPDGKWIDVSDADSFTPRQDDNKWGSFPYSLDLAQFSNEGAGTYTIWAKGYDKQGLESNIVTRNFEILQVNTAPEKLQFNVSVEGNTLNLTNGWIYDEEGYQDINYIDLWVKKEGGIWQKIEDITNFSPWANNADWSMIDHQIDLSNYDNGTYTIWAKGYDQQGLESNIVTRNFEILQVNTAPEKLQFDVIVEGNTVKLTNAWIYDEDGYQDLNNVDLWVRKEGEAWQDIADITNFKPWQPNNNWASIDYEINFSDYQSGSYEIWARGYDKGDLESNVVSKDFDILTSSNDNHVPSDTSSYIKIDEQVYNSNDTLTINNGWVRDLNGIDDIKRIDFWLIKEGEGWQDIQDISSDEITPWTQDTTWGSFDYSLGLTGLTPGNYTLWSGVQDQTLVENGTWANIVQNTFEIQA